MSDLKLQIILSAIDKATAPFKSVHKNAQVLARGVVEAKGKLKELEKQQKLIDTFKHLKTTLTQNTEALAAAKTKAETLAAAISKAGVPTRAMKKDYQAATAEVVKLSTKQADLTQKAHANRKALGDAGIKTRELSSAQSALSKNTTATVAAIAKQEAALKKASEAQAKHSALSEQYSNGMAARDKLASAGVGTMAAGATMLAPVAISVKNFAEAEDAATQLKVAMMTKGGNVSDEFAELNALAMELGNRLPGTTADFQNLMTMLKRQGMSNNVILGGTGEAAAYLAVQLKMAPEAAAEFAAKMQDATRTSEADMMSLMDTIQKGFYAGVESNNMLAAFTDLAPAMDTINIKGAEGAKALAPLVAQLDQAGVMGGSAGNALRKIFQKGMDNEKIQKALGDLKEAGRISKDLTLDFTDGKGEFGGLKQMYSELEKLKGLNTETRLALIKEIYGDNAEVVSALSSIIEKGQAGYDEFAQKIDAQASLQERVGEQLGTLKNVWEAAEGTVTNVSVAIGETLAPELKAAGEWFGNVAEKTGQWIKEHPVLTSVIVKTVAVIGALLVVLGGLMVAAAAMMTPLIILRHGVGLLGLKFGWFNTMISATGKAFMWLGRTFLMNPIGLAITAIVVAAVLLYTHWETVKNAIVAGWQWLDTVFANNPILNALFPIIGVARLVINHWDTVKVYLGAAWAAIKAVAVAAWDGLIWYISNVSPLAPIIQNWDAILTFLRGLKDKMLELGKYVIDGLISGIKAGLGELKSVWNSVNNMMPDMFKKKMEVNSPSRLMRRLGGSVMEGLTQGVGRGQGALVDTFGRAVDFFSDPLGVPAFPVPKLATGGGTGGGVGGFMPRPQGGGVMVDGGNNYYITIQAPSGEAKDIAREVEKAVAKIEADRARRARSSFQDKD